MTGKGDRPRPGTYSKQFRDNWDRIFKKKERKKDGDKANSKRKR